MSESSLAFAKKIMQAVLAENLVEKTKDSTSEQHLQITQDYVDAMVLVSGRLIVAHLMKRMSEGAQPEEVTEDALTITETVANNLLLAVDSELAHALDMAEDLLNNESSVTGKTKSTMSH